MRNTTKLKLLLLKYKVSFDMDEDENILMTIIDKRNDESETFIHKNYTAVVRKAFFYMNKQIKEAL